MKNKRVTEMTIEQEIEDAIDNGAYPLFLFGLVNLASTGRAEQLMEIINRVGQKRYLSAEEFAK